MGLQLLNRSVTKDWCRAACCNDPGCEVWQWATKRSKRDAAGADTMSCYTGRGFECQSIRTDDFLVIAGQRVSHGTKLAPSVWCTGNGMRHNTQISQRMSHKERVDSCRSGCFFDKDCQVWQYSTLKGCWSGHASSHQCFEDVSLAGTIMDSQKFVCGAANAAPETNYLMVFLVILSAALLLLCFAIIVLFFGLCGPKSLRPQSPRAPKSSRRQEADEDDDGSQPAPQDLSRGGGLYRALQPNSNPSSSNPSPSISMSEPGSMGPLIPGYQPGMATPPASGGVSPMRPLEMSFGGQSSDSSFSGQPLLAAPAGYPQPVMQQVQMASSPMAAVDPRIMQILPLQRR